MCNEAFEFVCLAYLDACLCACVCLLVRVCSCACFRVLRCCTFVLLVVLWGCLAARLFACLFACMCACLCACVLACTLESLLVRSRVRLLVSLCVRLLPPLPVVACCVCLPCSFAQALACWLHLLVCLCTCVLPCMRVASWLAVCLPAQRAPLAG